MAKITVSMGGRAAEEVVMNTMTNGASQDIQEATSIARNMVAMFGMSDEFGMMALGSVRNQYLDGGYGLDCAQETAAVMDKEVKILLDKCYRDAVTLIRENLELCGLSDRARVRNGDSLAYLRSGEKFDLVFLDPPYDTGLLEQALQDIAGFDICREHGIIMAESPADAVLPPLAAPYRLYREYRYGRIKLTVYHRQGNEE